MCFIQYNLIYILTLVFRYLMSKVFFTPEVFSVVRCEDYLETTRIPFFCSFVSRWRVSVSAC